MGHVAPKRASLSKSSAQCSRIGRASSFHLDNPCNARAMMFLFSCKKHASIALLFKGDFASDFYSLSIAAFSGLLLVNVLFERGKHRMCTERKGRLHSMEKLTSIPPIQEADPESKTKKPLVRTRGDPRDRCNAGAGKRVDDHPGSFPVNMG